jgi:glycosyltransferase involved in cell wall biosynthesis
VAVSNVVLQNYLASTKFKGKTVVIGNYVPDDYFQLNRNGRDSKQLRLVALGNIKAVKNQQYLLRAFSFLKNMPVSCDVYGEGTDRLQFEEKARAEKLAVYFKGSVADSRAVLANYDLYIMPSLTEGFPLSLFEAAAVGLPPVVSDIPVFHEVLDDCGDYLPLNDPGQLRIVIQKYLANPDLLEQKSREIKKLALKKASRTTYVQKLEMLYSSLSAPI